MRTHDLIILKVLNTVSQRQPVAPPKQTTTHKPRNMFFGSREKLRCKLPTLEATHITNQNWQTPPLHTPCFCTFLFFLLGFFCCVAGLRLTVTRIKGQPCLSIAARMAQMHLKESMRLSDGAER